MAQGQLVSEGAEKACNVDLVSTTLSECSPLVVHTSGETRISRVEGFMKYGVAEGS